jgi:hypothetical protein
MIAPRRRVRCAKEVRAARLATQTRKKLRHLRCGLCCAHTERARTDRTERACCDIHRPANVTVRDKHDGYAADAPIWEQQLETDRSPRGTPAAQTPSVVLAVRSRFAGRLTLPNIVYPERAMVTASYATDGIPNAPTTGA